MSLTLDGTNGITSSGGVNVLQDDSVVTGNLVDGAVTIPKIGATGTPGSGNFLRGDGSWQPVDVSGEIALFASGAPGQPRLVGNAVSPFPGTYPVLTVTASDDTSVENGIVTSPASSAFTSSSSFIDGTKHTILKYTGSIRFSVFVDTDGFGDGTSWQLRVLKNGTEVTSFTGSQSFSQTTGPFTADISIVPDDVILWQIRKTGGSTTNVRVRNRSNTATNGYLLRPLFGTFL
jgi:hypothetical protein